MYVSLLLNRFQETLMAASIVLKQRISLFDYLYLFLPALLRYFDFSCVDFILMYFANKYIIISSDCQFANYIQTFTMFFFK